MQMDMCGAVQWPRSGLPDRLSGQEIRDTPGALGAQLVDPGQRATLLSVSAGSLAYSKSQLEGES